MSMLITALLLAAPAAPGYQSTEAIDELVTLFTSRPIGVEGGARTKVDSRLRLAACAAPQMEWRNEAHDAVVVRCMAPEWRIFVPVIAPPPPPKPVAVVAAPVVKAEPVIRRGDPVTVEAGAAGFSITRDGIAMGDAAPGGRLLVKVDEKKPPIQTVALETGRARLPGFSD